MKKRHVLAVLLLSYITLGIYVIYWLYKTRKEILAYSSDKKSIPRVIVLFLPLFFLIALTLISFGIAGSTETGESPGPIAFIFLILSLLTMLAIFVVAFWWFYRYFTGLERTVRGNDAMLFYILWITLSMIGLGPIWVLLVQSDLNKFIDNKHQPLKMYSNTPNPNQTSTNPPGPIHQSFRPTTAPPEQNQWSLPVPPTTPSAPQQITHPPLPTPTIPTPPISSTPPVALERPQVQPPQSPYRQSNLPPQPPQRYQG